MKFTIIRSKFLEGLKSVQNIVAGKGSLPILQNVLLEAKNNVLTLTTTDLDISIKSEVECEVAQEGASTLPVKLLFNSISKAREGEVEVEIDANDHATVIAGSAKFKLEGGSVSADYAGGAAALLARVDKTSVGGFVLHGNNSAENLDFSEYPGLEIYGEQVGRGAGRDNKNTHPHSDDRWFYTAAGELLCAYTNCTFGYGYGVRNAFWDADLQREVFRRCATTRGRPSRRACPRR